MISLASQHGVIRKTDERRPPPHQTRPVHRHQRDGRRGREEREEDDENQKAGGEYVDRKTGPAQRPRSEVKGLPLHALDDHEHDDGQVGCEEPGHGQRDDGVERDRRADVDEADDRGHDGAEGDGSQGQRRPLVDVREEVGKRQPPVPGERPGLSGRGGEEAE